MDRIRIGIVGLGANTRSRHVPGFQECEGVDIVAVCNRRPESTAQAAREFAIPKTYDRWQDLVADPDVDAVMIGTWPYLHCDVTLAALDSDKHVLTEARMAMNAEQAQQMVEASRAKPGLVTQVVPSPFGLRGNRFVRELLDTGYLGELREVAVLGSNSTLADPSLPLHWRQRAELSGVNMLALGILHETLTRWVPQPTSVMAQAHVFTRKRRDSETGMMLEVTSPDCVHVLGELPQGARVIYHLSGVLHHGPAPQIHLYGSERTLKYWFLPDDRLEGGTASDPQLTELVVPQDMVEGWRVEADFVDAIRGQSSVSLTDFETGLRYMQFTEAVAESIVSKRAVEVEYGC